MKMIKIDSTAEHHVDNFMLTYYVYYLIAQNGNPQRESIAFSQSYFAVQTKKQEVIEERILL